MAASARGRNPSRVSPHPAHGASAGVGPCVARELAVKLRKQRDAVGEAKLRARRNECRILHAASAVDNEARARKRFEGRGERSIAHPVVALLPLWAENSVA